MPAPPADRSPERTTLTPNPLPGERLPGPRTLLWLQLLIGWLPVWALFTTLIVTAHSPDRILGAALVALRMMLTAAALGLLVHRLVARLPWPHPFRLRFVALHLLAAVVYAGAWVAVNAVADLFVFAPGMIIVRYPVGPYLILGIWMYVMVAGVAYAAQATARAARAETMAARAQLAALRAQLHPHFLFNALHTVVHLIPREPRQAAQAAEQLGDLLRATIDQDRDLVPLREERAFVERYLDLERLRFGDRLQVRVEVEPLAEQALVPAFALQTLVENAVRHGAAPRVESTVIAVTARRRGDTLALEVRDSGGGAAPEQLAGRQGSGLRRLRERLAVLYGDRARLELDRGGGGFIATLTLPWQQGDERGEGDAAGAPLVAGRTPGSGQ